MTTKTVQRKDVNKLTLGVNVQETPQGFLVIPAFTARTGIQRYRLKDGSMLNEHRPADEVFSEASMSSLRTAAVTDGHPKGEFVNPKNAKKLIVGHTDGTITRERDGAEEFLKTNLVITHQSAIDAIRAGKAQLSNGYTVDLDFQDGEHNGERYDAVQKNIVNNHIALVWKARAGDKASLRLDSDEGILLNDEAIDFFNNDSTENEKMKIKLGDKEFEVSDEIGAAFKEAMKGKKAEGKKDADEEIKKLTEKADDLGTEIEVLKASKTKLVAKCDQLTTDLEKKTEVKLDGEDFDKAVKNRMAVVDSGKRLLDKETVSKLDEMSNEEIKIAVIKVDNKDISEEKTSDSNYVNARFDMICEGLVKADEGKKKLGSKIVEGREENNDGEDDYKTPDQIRQANMDALENGEEQE